MKKNKLLCKRLYSVLLLITVLFTTTGFNLVHIPKVLAVTDEYKTDSERFEEFTDQLFKEVISKDILNNNTFVIDSSLYGVDQKDVPKVITGYDISLEQQIEASKETTLQLATINYKNLTSDQQDLYDLIKFKNRTPEQIEKFQYYEKAFGSYSGLQTSVISALVNYNFDERQDFIDYLELLKSVPDLFAQAVTYEQKRSELGLFMSDRELDAVIKSMNDLIANPENMVLITAFDHTVDKFDLNNSDQVNFKVENKEVVLTKIIPAYRQTIKDLNALRGTGIGDDDGLSVLPNGKEYYRMKLREYTGSTRSPEDYLVLFNKLSEECYQEIQSILSIANEKNWKLPSAKYGMNTPEEYLSLLMENTKKDFTPLENISFTIKYVDEALGTFVAPAYVFPPQVDAKDVLNININPAYAGSAAISTLCHEGYPGHLYQFATLNKLGKEPIRNAIYNLGFIEGWATFNEARTYYYTDCSELFARYAYLLTLNNMYQMYKYDILINYFGYTKKEALASMKYNQIDDATAEMLYYHFIDIPVYNNCYVGGLAELQLMVQKAQEALGDKFSLKEFNDFYLSKSSCTFETVNKRLDEWLATK